MINVKPGKILISAPSLEDDYFERAVIFVTVLNPHGAVGFTVNNLYSRAFNDLLEFKKSRPFPLYEGGPVKTDELFFLHCRPDLIDAGNSIFNGIYQGGNMKQAVQHINDGTLAQNEIKLFLGYCGWEYGDMEDEIAEGSWLVVDSNSTAVINPLQPLLWEDLYEEWKKS